MMLESLSAMAEIYIMMLVAAPLLFVVLFVTLGMIGSGGIGRHEHVHSSLSANLSWNPNNGCNNDGNNVNIRKVITNENNQKNNKKNINHFRNSGDSLLCYMH